MKFQTEQEQFWAGEFGDAYVLRADDAKYIASDTALFTRIFKRTKKVESVLELGANVGLNIKAIKQLFPTAQMAAVEINKNAVKHLKLIEGLDIHNESIHNYKPEKKYDIVFTKGVLIHINPEKLLEVYELMYRSALKYILIAEYYNPYPMTVESYRGNKERLFKRDFAGELLDNYSDLQLIDYGFVYKRDVNFPQDDINWFLLEKKKT